MTQTFKNDDSFFTVIMPIGTPIGFWGVYKWVGLDSNARFRFIRDLEIEQYKLTVKEIKELYPGVKTIGIVTNPWARMAWSYEMITNPPGEGKGIKEINTMFEGIDFTTFDTFVNSIQTCKALNGNPHPTTPQSHWLEQDGASVDLLLRSESINEDFKPIQEYFCTDSPLNVEDFNFDYRPYYTDNSKERIQNLMSHDIEKYGYSF